MEEIGEAGDKSLVGAVAPDNEIFAYGVRKLPLWQIVARLGDPSFSPDEVLADLKGKVDAIEYILGEFDTVVSRDPSRNPAWLDRYYYAITEMRQTLNNNRERLRKRIVEIMTEKQYERLPGNTFSVKLKRTNPSIQMPLDPILKREMPPTAMDYEKWPKFVKMERKYVWDKDAMHDYRKANGDKLPEGFPGKVIENFWPDFVLNIPETLSRPKKRGKNHEIRERS